MLCDRAPIGRPHQPQHRLLNGPSPTEQAHEPLYLALINTLTVPLQRSATQQNAAFRRHSLRTFASNAKWRHFHKRQRIFHGAIDLSVSDRPLGRNLGFKSLPLMCHKAVLGHKCLRGLDIATIRGTT